MTKYVKKDKFEKSLEYATNTLNRVELKRAPWGEAAAGRMHG